MDVRYDPKWIGDENKKLPIYFDGKKSGEAWMVRFHDNAIAKRKFPGNNRNKHDLSENVGGNVISYSDIGGDSNV
jgi:hypothetical protein